MSSKSSFLGLTTDSTMCMSLQAVLMFTMALSPVSTHWVCLLAGQVTYRVVQVADTGEATAQVLAGSLTGNHVVSVSLSGY